MVSVIWSVSPKNAGYVVPLHVKVTAIGQRESSTYPEPFTEPLVKNPSRLLTTIDIVPGSTLSR